jgi:hypothetical protein
VNISGTFLFDPEGGNMSSDFQQTTRRYIPESRTLYTTAVRT